MRYSDITIKYFRMYSSEYEKTVEGSVIYIKKDIKEDTVDLQLQIKAGSQEIRNILSDCKLRERLKKS